MHTIHKGEALACQKALKQILSYKDCKADYFLYTTRRWDTAANFGNFTLFTPLRVIYFFCSLTEIQVHIGAKTWQILVSHGSKVFLKRFLNAIVSQSPYLFWEWRYFILIGKDNQNKKKFSSIGGFYYIQRNVYGTYCTCMTAPEKISLQKPPFVCIWFKINSVKTMQKLNLFQSFWATFLHLVSLTLLTSSFTTFQTLGTSAFCKQERFCSQPCIQLQADSTCMRFPVVP